MAGLPELLLGYDVNVLKEIAREHKIDVKNQNKSALASRLAQAFSQREQVARALASLNPVEHAIVTRIQRAGGEIAVGALKGILQRDQAIGLPPRPKSSAWGYISPNAQPAGNPRYSGKPTLEDAAARLLLLGLAFSREIAAPTTSQVIHWELGRFLVIPKEIRAFLPAPSAPQMTAAPEPARIEPGSARSFQRDLSRYVGFVRRAGKIDLTQAGYVYKKTFLEIARTLGLPENKKREEKNELYLYFLRRLSVALHLIEPAKVNGVSSPDESVLVAGEGKAYWTLPPAERVKAAYEAWLAATTWNELRMPQGAYGWDHRRPAPPELIQARRVIVSYLKARGGTGWVNLADLLDDIRLGSYEFLFPRKASARPYYGYGMDYSSPYYSSNNPFNLTYNGIQDEATGWDQVEGAIIRHIIVEPLRWLGLTDIGSDKEGSPARAYRLTAMGAWLLGVGAPVTIAEEGGRVVVQPNFQIVAMEPIAEGVLMTLDEFAQFEGGDHALTYRLTRESVYRGQRADWDVARIIAYLEAATHAALPQNVRRSLEEWQAVHERMTFRRGVTLLQAEDAAALDALFAHSALAPKLGRRVGEQVALPEASAPALADALRENAWLPVVTRRDQFNAPASAVADEEGNVTFAQRAPSVYAYEGIEPFAEILDPRHARITRERAGAAAQQGLSVPTMIARLRSVHRGEPPPKLLTRLKAWGKYFGDAKLGTLTLVEFRDEAARNELLADPELKPYLTRFDAGARPLALVRADALERVQALLAERGVDLRAFE
jgi:hypothetical protein